jgi:hypothetical protein
MMFHFIVLYLGANANLRKEQSEKKLLRLEKSELEVSLSTQSANVDSKIFEAGITHSTHLSCNIYLH